MARKHEKTELPKLAKVSAFFSSPITAADAGVAQYPIDQLAPNHAQPRKHFEAAEIKQLSESIKHCGVLEPLLVTKEINGQRTIIAGERRWRAARLAGLASVPVYELDLEEEIAAQVPLIENLLRRDLNPFEEMEGYLVLLEQQLAQQPDFAQYTHKTDKHGAEAVVRLLFAMRNAQSGRRGQVSAPLVNCVEEIFRAIGATSWQSFAAHQLSLRKLPEELQTALREGWLDFTKAMEIGRLTAERLGNGELARKARLKLLATARNENISLREVRARVAALLNSVTREDEGNDSKIKKRARHLFGRLAKNYAALDERKREKLAALLAQMERLLDE